MLPLTLNATLPNAVHKRSEEVSEGLRGALERSQREAEQLRSRLEISGDLAADEAGRAKEALHAHNVAR